MSPIPLSNDGAFYLRDAARLPVPAPYQRRWLLPRLLGADPRAWVVCTRLSLAATPLAAGLYFYARGLAGGHLAFAVALLCVLPGLRLPLRLPVLVDAPSFAGALLVAASATLAPWWVTLPASLLLGAARESAPAFAALWAWHPLPLVGVLAAGWRRRACPPPPEQPWLSAPLRSALALRLQMGLDSAAYVRPWGAALAGLIAPTWQSVATIALAHAQLLLALDTLRLAVWCAPVLVLGAAQTIPPAWWAAAIVVTMVHRETRYA